MHASRPRDEIGDRIYPVDERELSRTAREACAAIGRGLVLLVYTDSVLQPQAAFIGEADLELFFATIPDILDQARRAVSHYTPDEEYVLLKMERGKKPVLSVRELISEH